MSPRDYYLELTNNSINFNILSTYVYTPVTFKTTRITDRGISMSVKRAGSKNKAYMRDNNIENTNHVIVGNFVGHRVRTLQTQEQ